MVGHLEWRGRLTKLQSQTMEAAEIELKPPIKECVTHSLALVLVLQGMLYSAFE